MYKYVVFCLCVSLSGVLCDLDKEEGSVCEWDGVNGICAKETQCLTTLDTRGDPHPVCSKNGNVTIVCCTDCELFNNTRNLVLTYYWKDGNRARDSCLEYIDTLPYKCRDGGFYSGISKNYDEAKQCHTIGIGVWGNGGTPSPGHEPGTEYPHQVLMGFVVDLASVKWKLGGSIISKKYILTSATVNLKRNGLLKFVAMGIKDISDDPFRWQTHSVKRFIHHPDYKAPIKYNDIALIETEDTITFNKNVLPACLHVEAAADETAITTTWRDLKSESSDFEKFADTIHTIHLDKYSEEECQTTYARAINRNLKDGINYKTQMCYGSKSHSRDACLTTLGEALLIKTQFSHCIYTVIGVLSFGLTGGLNCTSPDVFTRVAPYKAWIESVVWA